jgi:hypothetical protein
LKVVLGHARRVTLAWFGVTKKQGALRRKAARCRAALFLRGSKRLSNRVFTAWRQLSHSRSVIKRKVLQLYTRNKKRRHVNVPFFAWRHEVRIARFPNPGTLFAHTELTLFVHNHRRAANRKRKRTPPSSTRPPRASACTGSPGDGCSASSVFCCDSGNSWQQNDCSCVLVLRERGTGGDARGGWSCYARGESRNERRGWVFPASRDARFARGTPPRVARNSRTRLWRVAHGDERNGVLPIPSWRGRAPWRRQGSPPPRKGSPPPRPPRRRRLIVWRSVSAKRKVTATRLQKR